MSVRSTCLMAMLLAGATSAWAQHTSVQVKPVHFGTIAGSVVDARGLVQSGILVTLTRQDGLFAQKVFTRRNGHFDFGKLSPGLYAVEINLPNFLPFSKAPIALAAGNDIVLDITLRTLAESMEIGLPANPAKAQDDWKWALRTASPVRPVLRFLEQTASANPNGADASESRTHAFRGTVVLSAGNEARAFGADPGLKTVFEMSYDWTNMTSLGLSGSAGWERGTPAASFLTAWNHRSDDGSLSSISAKVRQIFLPTVSGISPISPNQPTGQRVQSVSAEYRSEVPLTEHLLFRYGSDFDRISLGGMMEQWSPFAELTYSTSPQTQWTISYAGGAPKSAESLQAVPGLEQLLAIPQVSSRASAVGDGGFAMEAGRHAEAEWDHKVGDRYRIQASAFYDSLTDVAVSVAGDDSGFVSVLLKDPFSQAHFLDVGGYSSSGAAGALKARVSANADIVLGYTYATAIRAASVAADAGDGFQQLSRTGRESAVTMKIRSIVPLTRTQITTSYKWLPANTIAAGNPYDRSIAAADPYLNVRVVQPLPSPEIIPGQFEAIADFNNLLAQGYSQINAAGHQSYFLPSPRSFRGGFSFVF